MEAYNSRGILLKEQALYENVIENFEMASQVAPGVSLPLTNLGNGHHDESLAIILSCLEKGLSKTEVNLAVDLRDIVHDEQYLAAIQSKTS